MDALIQRIFAQVLTGDSVRWRAEHMKVDRLSDITTDMGSMTSGDLQIGQLGQRRVVMGDSWGGFKSYDEQQRPYVSFSQTDNIEYGRLGLPGSDKYIRYTPENELEAHGSIILPNTVSHNAIQTHKRYATDFLASGIIVSTDAEAYLNFEYGAIGFGNEVRGAGGNDEGWSVTNADDTGAAAFRWVYAYAGIDPGEPGWCASVKAASVDHTVDFRAEQEGDACAAIALSTHAETLAEWEHDRLMLSNGNAKLEVLAQDDGTNLSLLVQVKDKRDDSVKGRLLIGRGNIAGIQEGDLYYDYAQHRWETHNGTAVQYLNMTAA